MNPKYEFQTARGIVFQLLKNEPRCREDDKWLSYRVYEAIAEKYGKKVYVPFELFKEFPSFETISRIRRKLQNRDKLFLPSAKTAGLRQEKEEWVKKWAKR